MSKPDIPFWATGSEDYRVEPPDLTVGWIGGEKCPAEYMNWLQYQAGQWCEYVDTLTDTICVCKRTTAQTLSTNDIIEWDADVWDPLDMHLTGSNTDRITIQANSGVYVVSCNVIWATGTIGKGREIGLFKNTDQTPLLGMDNFICVASSTINPCCTFSGIVGGADVLSTGDYLTVHTMHDESGTTGIMTGRLSLHRIS
jgi:hypothetical protein